MNDMMFVAETKADWDAFVVPPNVLVDEIGPIEGDARYHVNVRCPMTSEAECNVLKAGGTNVAWIDPTTVATPFRIWCGGMDWC
jgi:hypothetical protein